LKFLSFGFIGAGYLGAIVGFIIVILNINLRGWYPDNWPNQYIVIFFVMLIGFNIGLAKGYVSQRGQP
jgi:ABC-type xylose transport system permease subunit